MAEKLKGQPVPASAPAVGKAVLLPDKVKIIEAKKLARQEMRKRIFSFLTENAEQLGNLKTDIESFIGKGPRATGAGQRRSSIKSDLRKALLDAGAKGIAEMDIFKRFHLGRPEMTTMVRCMLLDFQPNDRVWFVFDEALEIYRVIGTGANPPQNWDGYVPAKKEAL